MTQPYEIVLKRSVLKDIRRIPASILQSIQQRIVALADNAFPPGMEPIEGYEHHYRIRIGNYRVLYKTEKTITSSQLFASHTGKMHIGGCNPYSSSLTFFRVFFLIYS